ncbi:MAG: sodium:solute symporter family protein [Calditrichaeota bacterium]|nr:sodium:solute symporter family protein [Calditrichota bacterium]
MIFAWLIFLIYVSVTLGLAWKGHQKTDSFRSYAIGMGDMKPWVVAFALAASMTSTATFVINPGIVYAYGLSAVLGYGVAAGTGLMLGIVILSKGFRRYGIKEAGLTVPDWIGRRFGSRKMAAFYAVVNLLLIAMVVLICYAMAGLLVATLQLPAVFPNSSFEVALAIIVVFVFAYTYIGGTYAHAYTNMVQGLVMLVVAVLLVGSGIPLLQDNLLEKLAAIDPLLAQPIHPGSLLFRNVFEVFVANFVVGFALAAQPHFVIKSLYVRSERDVNRYLALAILIGVVFTSVLLCGLYARVARGPFVEQFIQQNQMGIDGVMPAYIVSTFPPLVALFISIAILAAGMSTLDGIVVALSAILANDLFLPWYRRRKPDPRRELQMTFRVGRIAVLALGGVAFGLSLYQHYHKEFSIAIFAQEGVYALFAATFIPLMAGMFFRNVSRHLVWGTSLVALGIHFGFRYGKWTLLTPADYTNPGLTATYGLLVSLGIVAYYVVGKRLFSRSPSS